MASAKSLKTKIVCGFFLNDQDSNVQMFGCYISENYNNTLILAIRLPLRIGDLFHSCNLPWVRIVAQRFITLFIHKYSNHNMLSDVVFSL